MKKYRSTEKKNNVTDFDYEKILLFNKLYISINQMYVILQLCFALVISKQ